MMAVDMNDLRMRVFPKQGPFSGAPITRITVFGVYQGYPHFGNDLHIIHILKAPKKKQQIGGFMGVGFRVKLLNSEP